MQPIALRTIFFLLLGITTLNKGSAQGQTAGADNTYCVATKGAQYETTNFAPSEDGWAKLPERCVRTAMADTPQRTPVVKRVCADGACDFRSVDDAL